MIKLRINIQFLVNDIPGTAEIICQLKSCSNFFQNGVNTVLSVIECHSICILCIVTSLQLTNLSSFTLNRYQSDATCIPRLHQQIYQLFNVEQNQSVPAMCSQLCQEFHSLTKQCYFCVFYWIYSLPLVYTCLICLFTHKHLSSPISARYLWPPCATDA